MNRRLIITAAPDAVTLLTQSGGYTLEGEFDYRLEDLDAYVQVAPLWGNPPANVSGIGLRTFRDPSKQLVEGAYVKVPLSGSWAVGKVVALGRGADLPSTQGDDVIAVLSEQAL